MMESNDSKKLLKDLLCPLCKTQIDFKSLEEAEPQLYYELSKRSAGY